MIRSTLVSLILTVLLCFSAEVFTVQAQAISNPEGEPERLTPEDFLPKTMHGSQFSEFWNFQFYFDNGMKAHIIFSLANFSRMQVTGVRVSIFGLDNKKVYQLSREYPIEDFKITRDTFMLELNPRQKNVWFGGDLSDEFNIYINTAKDGERFNIELNITDIVQGFQMGDGKYQVHDESIGLLTHIPFAKVTGRVGINDNIKDVSGTAYMDHTYQNQTTTTLMHSGYRFVYHKDKNNWDVMYYMQPKNQMGKQTVGYRISSSNGRPNATSVVGIINSIDGKAFKDNLPESMTLYFENQETATITRTIDEEKHSILGNLSWLARQAARAFIGGDIKDYRGTATLEAQQGKIIKKGEYNYFVVD